jgi:hypothetical protein
MNKYIALLSFFLVGCSVHTAEPMDLSVVYGTTVKTKGFYKTCESFVIAINSSNPRYLVKSNCHVPGLGYETYTGWYRRDDFEIVKGT